MSLKKGGGPKTIPVTLTVTGQGSTDKLEIVFHNRKGSEVRAKTEGGATMAQLLPFLIASWDLEFPLTEEGIRELEDEYPGMVEALIDGFWKARRKEVEGN